MDVEEGEEIPNLGSDFPSQIRVEVGMASAFY